MPISDRQKKFAEEYLTDFNPVRAYECAGYTGKSDRAAYDLLKKPEIREFIEEGIRQRRERPGINGDKILLEVANIAFANGADYMKVTEDGEGVPVLLPVATEKLSADKLSAINSYKKTSNGIEVKLYDKLKALELLGKHLGIFDRKDSEDTEDIEDIRSEIFKDDDQDS